MVQPTLNLMALVDMYFCIYDGFCAGQNYDVCSNPMELHSAALICSQFPLHTPD